MGRRGRGACCQRLLWDVISAGRSALPGGGRGVVGVRQVRQPEEVLDGAAERVVVEAAAAASSILLAA